MSNLSDKAIKLASELPKGSEGRKSLLNVLAYGRGAKKDATFEMKGTKLHITPSRASWSVAIPVRGGFDGPSSGSMKFWFEPKGVQNRTVKEYEDSNLGTSSRSGELIIKGKLLMESEGWDMAIPINAVFTMGEHGPSGTLYFNAKAQTPETRLVEMAIMDYKVEDAIMKLLGKVEFVYHEDNEPYTPSPQEMLAEALRMYGPLPTEGGGSRKVPASEFMLMRPDPVRGHYQWKHDRTRNYVFVNADTGKLVIPKSERAFMRGEF